MQFIAYNLRNELADPRDDIYELDANNDPRASE